MCERERERGAACTSECEHEGPLERCSLLQLLEEHPRLERAPDPPLPTAASPANLEVGRRGGVP